MSCDHCDHLGWELHESLFKGLTCLSIPEEKPFRAPLLQKTTKICMLERYPYLWRCSHSIKLLSKGQAKKNEPSIRKATVNHKLFIVFPKAEILIEAPILQEEFSYTFLKWLISDKGKHDGCLQTKIITPLFTWADSALGPGNAQPGFMWSGLFETLQTLPESLSVFSLHFFFLYIFSFPRRITFLHLCFLSICHLSPSSFIASHKCLSPSQPLCQVPWTPFDGWWLILKSTAALQAMQREMVASLQALWHGLLWHHSPTLLIALSQHLQRVLGTGAGKAFLWAKGD